MDHKCSEEHNFRTAKDTLYMNGQLAVIYLASLVECYIILGIQYAEMKNLLHRTVDLSQTSH